MHLTGGAVGRAIAPAGASTGSGEAIELRDGGTRLGGRDVQGAVAAINGEIAEALAGHDAADQAAIDRGLIELDGTPQKSRLGGNALVAVSMAALHAAAAAAGKPLYAYLLGEAAEAVLPLPEIQIFGGGAHAGRRVDIQDFMIVAPEARSFDQALEWTAEVYRAAGELMAERGLLQGVADEGGFWPAFDSNEAALDALLRGDRAGRLHARGRRSRSRSTSPPPSSAATAATGWRSTDAPSIPTAWPRCCSAGSTATRSCRSRIRWPRTMPRAAPLYCGSGRPGADRRRRFPGHDAARVPRPPPPASATPSWSSRTRPAP